MPIYMQYDGIDGDVTATGHEKWIELTSLQWHVGRSINMPIGSDKDRESSAPSVGELVITKESDCASTKLLSSALEGEGKTVKIDVVKTDAGKLEPYMQYTLEDTLISSYSVSAARHSSNGSGERPMESISLNFTKVEFKFTGMSDVNATGSPDTVGYDLGKGQKT